MPNTPTLAERLIKMLKTHGMMPVDATSAIVQLMHRPDLQSFAGRWGLPCDVPNDVAFDLWHQLCREAKAQAIQWLDANVQAESVVRAALQDSLAARSDKAQTSRIESMMRAMAPAIYTTAEETGRTAEAVHRARLLAHLICSGIDD
jgi:hypothetical protein